MYVVSSTSKLDGEKYICNSSILWWNGMNLWGSVYYTNSHLSLLCWGIPLIRCRWKFTHSGIMSDFAWNWFHAGQWPGSCGSTEAHLTRRRALPYTSSRCSLDASWMQHASCLYTIIHWTFVNLETYSHLVLQMIWISYGWCYGSVRLTSFQRT